MIIHGEIENSLEDLPDKSIDLVFTSPPYAEQRKKQYGGVTEDEFPSWVVSWMDKLKPKMRTGGSVIINIRPHLKHGKISDYVLKTRLALRESGWDECEELIWIKPDSPPLGSINRPRRAWESLLWFSLDAKIAYCDTKANGTKSNRIGFENGKFDHGGDSHIHAGQNIAKEGVARSRDYIEVGTGKIEKGWKHPAMFPVDVAEQRWNCPRSIYGKWNDSYRGFENWSSFHRH